MNNKVLVRQKFWNKSAEKYSKKPVPNEEVYQKKLDLTQKFLNSNSSVLEIGCGTGSTAIHHAPSVRKIIAADFSQEMIGIAQRKAAEADIHNIEFRVESVESMKYEAHQFDLIMAHSILHLLEDIDRTLDKLISYLNTGGLLVLTVPFIGEVKWFRYLWKPLYSLGVLPYINIFSRKDFESKITKLQGVVVEHNWQPDSKSGFYIIRKLS